MRRLRGLAAFVGLVAIVVGMPVLLMAVAGIGVPSITWSLAGVVQALLNPDDGTLMLTVFKLAGWVTWAILTFSIVVEVVASLRHIPAPSLRGFRVPQRFAHRLVASAAVLFIAAGTLTSAAGSAAAQPDPRPAPTQTVAQVVNHKAPATQHASHTYKVKKGDTLSAIAKAQTGRASNYPELFRASTHTAQPGGRHLSNPDLILPGWKITVPDAAPSAGHGSSHVEQGTEPRSEQPAPTPAETAGSQASSPSAPASAPASSTAPVETAGSGGGAAQAPVPVPAADAAETDESVNPAWLLCGLAGAGSLLAGALWLAVGRRRAAQFRSRRPGRAVSAPAPQLAPVEKTLIHEGAPTGSLVLFIDEVLRRMATRFVADGQMVPAVVGLDVAETRVTVRLAAATKMPSPWQSLDAESQVWRVARDVDLDELGPLEPDSPPPWPQMVTLGWDSQGWRLVNLESLGVVSITGDPVYGTDLARYLVSELAVSPWSRDVEIDCLEICAELPGLAPARLRYHDADEVVADTVAAAVATIDRLGELDSSSLETARTLQAGDELWDSRVLVSAAADAAHLDVLESLLVDNAGHTATSLLLVDSDTQPAGVEMQLTSNGRVLIPALGLDLVVNGLTEAEARGCVAVLAAGEALADVEVPVIADPQAEWQTLSRVDGSLREDLTVPRGTTPLSPASSVLPDGDAVYLDATANTAEDLAALAPLVPESVRERVEAVDPDLDADLADWYATSCARPKLQVMGPLKVRVGAGGDPAKAAARVGFYTELVAYLGSRPSGATTEEVAEALGIAPLRVRKDISVVRSWLGTNPASGEPWLPEATKHRRAVERGMGLYLVDGLLSDADLFLRLRMRGQARGSAGMEDLRQALQLVVGAPYDDMRARGGIWLAESREDQNLLCAVVDVAHVVSTIALGGGDVVQARAAAELAALTAPHEATPQLDLAAVAASEGDRGTTASIARSVVTWRDGAGDPIDLPDRAAKILRAKQWLSEASAKAG